MSRAGESRWSIPNPRISIVRQCRLVSIARSSFYDAGTGESPLTLRLMRLIDEQLGDAVLRLAADDTLAPPSGRHGLSQAGAPPDATAGGARALPAAQDVSAAPWIYPYLLRDLPITRPNHVWCTDVTYIPLRRGFLHLVAVMDGRAARSVLAPVQHARCQLLRRGVARGARALWPSEIFDSDQGSQFTSVDVTDVLTEAGIRISMDGKGRWMDNVFIERLWRSLKYECVYLSEFATGSQARTGIGGWMDFYNERRPHSALDDRTPQEAYTDGEVARSPGLRPVSRQPKVA